MSATEDEIAELLGERGDESIIERIVNTGASIDDVHEAFEDLEFEARLGEQRLPASPMIEEVRRVLEELPYFTEIERAAARGEGDEELEEAESLSVVEADELFHEV